MVLESIDWVIIISFFIISLGIGLYATRSASKNVTEFFLSGKNMPWWILGVSMVATTFSADTPNLVTDIVRKNGVSGNWVWWIFLLTGMLTVFVYAKLWKRSNVLTDIEFYELRYSGKMAAFLRGFRAIYLGFFFNVMIMATVSLAMIKIAAAMLGWSPIQTILITSSITVIYSVMGGLKGILLTDFFQFILSMIGAVGAAIILMNMPDVGGLSAMLANETVSSKLDFLPSFSDTDAMITLFIIPLAVQWWSSWYPGAEPGGGGYVSQRMLSAKSEKDAVSATFLFNAAHYALRPWPWILVALASLIVFPDLDSLKAAFPNVDASVINDDFAYPAMLSFLPNGFLGLVVASLIAAFMSTISTHLNWGSSYIVNDYYQRFVDPDASQQKLVMIGRISMVVMMIVAAIVALYLSNALGAFNILLQIGAGTGSIFILRWFWWRINAYSEISAMVVSFIIAIFFEFSDIEMASSMKLVTGVLITTITWIIVTLKTRPEDMDVLKSFVQKIHPGGPGWNHIVDQMSDDEKNVIPTKAWDVPTGILAMLFGCFAIYFLLFATGSFIYGDMMNGIYMLVGFIASFMILKSLYGKLNLE